MASSRIRVLSICKEFQKRQIPYDFVFSERTDILFIQKTVTQEVLHIVQDAKKLGCLVIFDVDDFGMALWVKASPIRFAKMLAWADVITTATMEQRNYVIRNFHKERVETIPNLIDYFPEGIPTFSIKTNPELKAVWFGGKENFKRFKKIARMLVKVENLHLCVIINPESVEILKGKYPNIEFIPWSLNTFVSDLQRCDISILTHAGSAIDRMKGNNKMITSIYWGVPAIVSRTPEYERMAEELQIKEFLFENFSELLLAIEKLRSPKFRRDYLACSQPLVWRNYSPSAITDELLNLVHKHPYAIFTERVYQDA